jgi:hypothetical protein
LGNFVTKLHRAAPRSNARMSRRLDVDNEIGQVALDHVNDPGNRVLGDGVDERITSDGEARAQEPGLCAQNNLSKSSATLGCLQASINFSPLDKI